MIAQLEGGFTALERQKLPLDLERGSRSEALETEIARTSATSAGSNSQRIRSTVWLNRNWAVDDIEAQALLRSRHM